MELAHAGLHQLCSPMLDHLAELPEPQRAALGAAFGLVGGDGADRFLVGVGVLGLLSAVSEERPLVCLVDDAQWLDRVSAQLLAFVARRLLAEPVALVFSVREPSDARELDGLPERTIGGLSGRDARALLDSSNPGRLDDRVRDRIVAETRGNPLALLEIPRGLSAADLAGGFALPTARPLASQIEQSFRRRVASLPEPTQRLLLLAAAEPLGDGALLRRAAESLGIGPDAETPAEDDGLIQFGVQVRFRHPLVRSAAYGAGSVADRQAAHRALAARDRLPLRRRSTRLAPGPRLHPARRGGRHRARVVGRSGPAPWWRGRRGRVPRAGDGADGRPGSASDQGGRRRRGQARSRGPRSGGCPCRLGGVRSARRPPAGHADPVAGADRLRPQPGQRCSSAAARSRPAARAPRRPALTRGVPRSARRRHLRGAPRPRSRRAGDRRSGAGSAGRAVAATSDRSAPGRHRHAVHRGVRTGGRPAQAGARGSPHHCGGRWGRNPALALAGVSGCSRADRAGALGRGDVAVARRPRRCLRSRGRGARRPPRGPVVSRRCARSCGGVRRGRNPDRRGGRDHRRNRQCADAVHGTNAGGVAGRRSGCQPTDRLGHEGRDRARRGAGARPDRLRDRGPPQRARPVPRSARRRPARLRARRSRVLRLVARGDGRSRCSQRRRRHGGQGPQRPRGPSNGRRHRVGPGHLGSLERPAELGRRR